MKKMNEFWIGGNDWQKIFKAIYRELEIHGIPNFQRDKGFLFKSRKLEYLKRCTNTTIANNNNDKS